jgi:enoyl-CoA hydratase/carnithine racemase
MFDLVITDQVARLTLSRPEARNAIPAVGWPLLGDAAEEAARSGARLLILSGKGQAFCAGADLAELASLHGDIDGAASFRRSMRSGLDRLYGLSIPTLAAIQGPCFGAGVALALACDIRIAGAAAQFAITPAKIGISYPQEDVERLVRLVGAGQAARLLLGSRPIDAAEAERIGLVERCAEGMAERIESFAAAVKGNSAASLATLKQGIRLAAAGIGRDERQDSRFDALLASDEAAARMTAMRKGRGHA